MLKVAYRLISITLIFGVLGQSRADYNQCKELLNWIYKELTLKNLDLSYQRAMDKMLLGFYVVHENTKESTSYKKKMSEIFNSLGRIDPELKKILKDNKSISYKKWWGWGKTIRGYLKESELQNVFFKWRELQENSPELFQGLDDKYKLDNWDVFSIDILSNVSKFNFSDSKLESHLESLGQSLKASSHNILEGKSFDDNSLVQSIDKTQREIMNTFNKNYLSLLDDYKNICDTKDFFKLQNNEQIYCPLDSKDLSTESINLNLKQLEKIITHQDLNNERSPTSTLSKDPLVKINLLDYKLSTMEEATYCTRDPKLVSMIVIHHTATSNQTTPYQINNSHINDPEHTDPWYMIGYNYLISSSFKGATPTNLKIFQGRPPKIQGAHTGGEKVPLTQDQKTYMQGKNIICGNKTKGFTTENIIEKAKKENGVNGNLFTYGIAIIGNYATEENLNLQGVKVPQNPIDVEEVSIQSLEMTAKLACELQRKNPRIKTIVPHSYFRKTLCPGEIKEHLKDIRDFASKLGCHFSVILTKEPQE